MPSLGGPTYRGFIVIAVYSVISSGLHASSTSNCLSVDIMIVTASCVAKNCPMQFRLPELNV